MATVYNIDAHKCFASALLSQSSDGCSAEGLRPATPKGRKREAKKVDPPTCSFPLNDLIDSSYFLSHMDVLRNMGDLDKCDSCHSALPDDYGRACDGCFPSNAGVHWPEGALGRQF